MRGYSHDGASIFSIGDTREYDARQLLTGGLFPMRNVEPRM